MIKLENISTLPLIGIDGRKLQISKKNKQMIEQLNITDFDKLKRSYYRFKDANSAQGFCFTDGLEKIILDVQSKLEESNKKDVNPELFEIEQVNRVAFEKQKQDLIDKNTYACDLLYGSPLEYGEDKVYKKRKLSLYNIYQLKHLLTHCDTDGNNLARKYLNVSSDEVKKILRALYLYQDQLERQFDEWDCALLDEKFLFYSNQELKKELIKPQIKEVSDYIIHKAKGLVWTDELSNEIFRIRNLAYKTDIDNLHRQKRFIEMLSNYATVAESEKGLVKTKALDRLIIK